MEYTLNGLAFEWLCPRDRFHKCDERHNWQKNRLISGVGLNLQITGFSAHDDNRKKISRTRVSYGSNSRHTHEVVPGDGDSIVLCRNHKNTWLVAREKRRVERLRKKVSALRAHRSKILEHRTPTPW
jgi:hypothetical protein